MTNFYIELENEDDFDKITTESRVCVVDLYTTWCGPCKTLAPKLETCVKDNAKLLPMVSNDITNLTNKLVFLKVDVEKFPNIAEKFGLTSIPLIHFYENGKLHNEKVVGAKLENIIKIVTNLTENM